MDLKFYIKEKTKIQKIIFFFSLGVIIFIACYYFFKSPALPMQDIKVVEIERISLKNIKQTNKLIGTIKAKHYTILTARRNGILKIVAKSGQQMKKGDLIAEIENKEIEDHYDLSISAELISREQLAIANSLLKSGTYSRNEFDAIKNDWISSEKDVVNSKIELEKLKIYAPFDGILASYKVSDGKQLIIDDVITSFYDPRTINVEFDIPGPIVPLINEGQNLTIRGKEYKLSYIQKILDAEKHMSPASVDIICDDCLIGDNIDVELSIIEKKNVIVIPFEAVFLKQEKKNVYVIEEGRASLREIELGLREKDLVEVISGLKEGENIVKCSTGRLYPNVQVKIHQ